MAAKKLQTFKTVYHFSVCGSETKYFAAHCRTTRTVFTWVYLNGLTHGVRPVEVERKTYFNTPPPHLSYYILNCCVVLLLTTFSSSAFHGMTTHCEKQFLRGSRLDLSLSSFLLCPFVEYQPVQRRYLLGFSPNRALSCVFPAGRPSFASLPTLSVYTPVTSAHMATFSMEWPS